MMLMRNRLFDAETELEAVMQACIQSAEFTGAIAFFFFKNFRRMTNLLVKTKAKLAMPKKQSSANSERLHAFP